jgi:hypothetical protein
VSIAERITKLRVLSLDTLDEFENGTCVNRKSVVRGCPNEDCPQDSYTRRVPDLFSLEGTMAITSATDDADLPCMWF